MASDRIPVESCGQIELQWYINNDGLKKKGLVVDAAKYNSESGPPTKADLKQEIEEKLEQKLLGNLCKGDKSLLNDLKEIDNCQMVLICRNVDDGDIYGFASMFASYRQQGNPEDIYGFALFPSYRQRGKTEIDQPVPNIMTIRTFCGHGSVCGVGQKMMKSIKQFCADHKLWTIYLDPWDEAAEIFYSKQGFVGPADDGYMIFNVKEAAAEPTNVNSMLGMESAAMVPERGGGKHTRRRRRGRGRGINKTQFFGRKMGRRTPSRWGFPSTRRINRRMLYRPLRR